MGIDDKKWLEEQVAQGISQRDIAKLCGVSTPTVRSRLKKFDIRPNTISEALKLKPVKTPWTIERKSAMSARMLKVQATRKSELAKSSKSNWSENRNKIVEGIRAAAKCPIRNKKLSDAAKDRWRTDFRSKFSEYMKWLWADHDHRRKMLDSIRASSQKEETREAIRKAARNPDLVELKRWYSSRPDVVKEFVRRTKENWSDDAYRSKMSLASKALLADEAFRTYMATMLANQPKISSLQTKLYRMLDEIGVQHHQEGPQTRIAWYNFDCLIPKTGGMKKHLLIECQGDYWHSLPRAVRNDKSKWSYVNRYMPEYEILYLWEREFSTKDKIISKLSSKLGRLNYVDFDFDDVMCREIGKDEAADFLGLYHYLPGVRSGHHYGAFIGELCVAVASFSKPLRQNMRKCVELSRFCIHPQRHKKNFASWCLRRFLSLGSYEIGDLPVVAFADSTVGHTGTIYRACGFSLDHEVREDYWYVDGDGFVMHKKTLYNRAVNLRLSESDFADRYGYVRKYGGKKFCYILL